MKKYIIVILVLTGFQIGFGQTRNKAVNEKIEAQRVAFITRQLDLSVQESQLFWPIYNDYKASLKILRSNFNIRGNVENLSEEEARQTIAKSFELQAMELDLKKDLNQRLTGVIPARKIVKLPIAERKFKQKLLERIKERRNNRSIRR